MIVICLFWLFDTSLMELYGRELVTGPTVAPLVMLFLWAFPVVSGVVMPCPTISLLMLVRELHIVSLS